MLHTHLRGAIQQQFPQVKLGGLFLWVHKRLEKEVKWSATFGWGLGGAFFRGSFTYWVIGVCVQENPPAALKGSEDFFSDKPIRFYDFDTE